MKHVCDLLDNSSKCRILELFHIMYSMYYNYYTKMCCWLSVSILCIFFRPLNLPRGLLGAHVMADLLRQRGERMQWYRDELLHMAKELGHRLLPAFNTTSGLPYPKVFLIFTVEYYRSSYFCQAKCVGEMCVCVCLLISHTIKPVSLTFCPHC